MKNNESTSRRFLILSLIASLLLIVSSFIPIDDAVKNVVIAVVLSINVFLLCVVLLGLFFSQRPWLVKTVCFFKKDAIPVQLIDFIGDVYTTIAVPMSNGYQANVYWFTSVGHCILRKNGTIDPESDSSFVYFWMPIGRNRRTEHVLMNDIPDFSSLQGMSKNQRVAFMRNEFEMRSTA